LNDEAVARTAASAAMTVAISCGGSGDAPNGPTPNTPGSAGLTAPTAVAPVNDAQVDTLRPTLTVRIGTSTGSGPRVYEFQVSDRSDFTTSATSYVPGVAVVVSQAGSA
jgi:hypothetical protein